MSWSITSSVPQWLIVLAITFAGASPASFERRQAGGERLSHTREFPPKLDPDQGACGTVVGYDFSGNRRK